MFCSNCGKAEQIPDSYCRGCGGFLASPGDEGRLRFGGQTPQQNLRTINILSLIAAIVSVHVGIWMYLTEFRVPFVLYLGAAVLLCNAVWHLSNYIVGTRLNRRLRHAQEESLGNATQIPSAKTRDLLPVADLADAVPSSITESTTRHLAEKIQDRSS